MLSAMCETKTVRISNALGMIKLANAPPLGLECKQMPCYCLGGWALVELTDALCTSQCNPTPFQPPGLCRD